MPFAAIEPTISPPISPGPDGGGDPVERRRIDPASAKRAAHQLVDMVEMRAGGDLRHDAAIGRVLGELRLDQVGADRRVRGPSPTTATAVSSQLVSMPRTVRDMRGK